MLRSACRKEAKNTILAAAMEGTDGCYRILLSHDPTQWEMEVIGKDIPLMLSGHTHAIQFSLLGWSPGCSYCCRRSENTPKQVYY